MMSDQTLICKDQQRRHQARLSDLNGLDYLDVLQNQLHLNVFFLGRAPKELTASNFQIEGGRRVRDIKVTDKEITCEDIPDKDDCIQLTVNKAGDFSTYTLRIVDIEGFDPRYTHLEFSFKADCPTGLDCQEAPLPAPQTYLDYPAPELNYLAKDYASFRRLILDRLALTIPNWQEDHIPDIGIALVETLAYTADHLSYYQDAVATEAYLDTARQRISVRRHVRLIDYQMHEGCNARAWVCLETTDNHISLEADKIYFITARNESRLGESGYLSEEALDESGILSQQYEVFEPLLDIDPQFQPADFQDLPGFAAHLREDKNPLAWYLWSQFSPETRDLLNDENLASTSLLEMLIPELNRILGDAGLYTPQRFQGFDLPPEVRGASGQALQGDVLIRFNRLLLENAYPAHFHSSKTISIYKDHSEIEFYTWGDRECCLPRGSVSATLKGKLVIAQATDTPCPETDAGDQSDAPAQLHLQAGDVLVFEEVIGPKTGNPADADPTHRCAVRLTRVEAGCDELYNQPVVEIEWDAADALPFPLCISAISSAPDCAYIEDINVARGNVMLVDHGRWIEGEGLGAVGGKELSGACNGSAQPAEKQMIPTRFNPILDKQPLVFSQALALDEPAGKLLTQDPRQALPSIWLAEQPPANSGALKPPVDDDDCAPDETNPSANSEPALNPLKGQAQPTNQPTSPPTNPPHIWLPRRDLLDSRSQERHFAAEIDNDSFAHLRFGDGELGLKPPAGATFTTNYRVGGGAAGNVGAEAISHLISRSGFTLSGVTFNRVRNPLPAQGGLEPEPTADVKLYAPHAFRSQIQRAITAEDYAHLAARHPKVQRAQAALRWNGSWYEVLVVIDPLGQTGADEVLLAEIAAYLTPYRRMGHELTVVPAEYVPLEIEMIVCVKPGYQAAHVKGALRAELSARHLPDGRRGFFHPDNLSFGQGISLSKLVAAAVSVAGVASVTVETFQRYGVDNDSAKESGVLSLGHFEIAQLDNDPNALENGRLTLTMKGE